MSMRTNCRPGVRSGALGGTGSVLDVPSRTPPKGAPKRRGGATPPITESDVPAAELDALPAPHGGGPDSLTAKAHTEILGRIRRLELRPGSAFTDGQLTAELGLSKTPVREALLVLASHGFVFPRPRNGYRVAPVTVKGARDTFALWGAVAPVCAAGTAGFELEPSLYLHLKDLAVHTLDVRDPDSVDAFVDDEMHLHAHLARECGNAQLFRVAYTVLSEVERLLRFVFRVGARFRFDDADHRALVAALAAGDADEAAARTQAITAAWERRAVEGLLDTDAVQAVDLGGALTSVTRRSHESAD